MTGSHSFFGCCLLLLLLGGQASECEGGVCSADDTASMMQSVKKADVSKQKKVSDADDFVSETRTKTRQFIYRAGASVQVGTALSHMRRWNAGLVANNLKLYRESLNTLCPGFVCKEKTEDDNDEEDEEEDGPVLAQVAANNHMEDQMKLSATSATQLLAAARADACATGMDAFQGWTMHSQATDVHGVQHALLRSPAAADGRKKQQYLATVGDHLLVQDPKMTCDDHDEEPEMDSPDLLDVDDELVHACEELVVRSSKTCSTPKHWTVKASAATLKIVDGYEVEMTASITTEDGGSTQHWVNCAFEVSDAPDAEFLLQTDDGMVANVDDEHPVDDDGLIPVLGMETDVCDADKQDDPHHELMPHDHPSLGEISFLKGNEHINDALGLGGVPPSDNTAENFDLKVVYPQCFTQKGKEVVRNQGGCGSCWAFAASSSLMNNLCISAVTAGLTLDQVEATASDRLEVSVQQVVSCNKAKRGCEGGNAAAADQAFAKGITKERDSKYACGAGDSLKHMDPDNKHSNDCSKFPWAGKCSKSLVNPNWHYGGGQGISGEAAMKAHISLGHSLYVSFQVYSNFFRLKSGIYTKKTGKKSGGHAVTGMGYGVDKGVKYWMLQNSWGPDSWGVKGFGRFLRGKDLCDVETRSYHFRAWVSGGDVPKCYDGDQAGSYTYNGSGKPVTCKAAKRFGLCKVASVKGSCPLTCKSCPSTRGTAPSPKDPAAKKASGKKATALDNFNALKGRCEKRRGLKRAYKKSVEGCAADCKKNRRCVGFETYKKKCYLRKLCTGTHYGKCKNKRGVCGYKKTGK